MRITYFETTLSFSATFVLALNFASSLAQRPVEPNRWQQFKVGFEFELARSYYKERISGSPTHPGRWVSSSVDG
jgi:hypothetical protein